MKRLVCFYCNKRSDLRYDGQMKQWPCATCEAVNYLDENGEITDPPVATTEPAPAYDLRYTAVRPAPPTTPISDSNPFCQTCLKNQHLYTTSLQQYYLETDPTHPQYRESEKAYYRYKKTLERTYPQVCEDCEPRVLERMRAASKTAKSDHLRRLMEKTRARRAAVSKSYSMFDLVLLLGKWLWCAGLAGQLLWNIMALVMIPDVNQPNTLYSFYLAKSIDFAQPLIAVATSRNWARYSFYCSLTSMWWNPRFKELNNGFMNHITGFSDWYKLQLLHIAIRSLFLYTMGSGVFSDLRSPATAGAHTMIPIFILLLAFKSKRALKVDMTPLWNSTPEKLPYVGPSSGSPRSGSPSQEGMGGLAGILDEIAATPSKSLRQPSPPSAHLLSQTKPLRQQNSHDAPPIYRGISSTPFRDIPQTNSKSYMSAEEAYYPQEYAQAGVEEMEWSPSVPQTQTTIFTPTRPIQPKPHPFAGASGIDRPSPFYGRLPEAPIPPAHRLRNPPNQARLRVSSQEVKENFFNNITRRGANQADGSNETSEKREMNLAQQRFFPPQPPNEAGNVLADLLTSFSLSSPEANTPAISEERSARARHMWQALVLLLGLFFWNNSAVVADAEKSVMATVMIACAAIGIRTVLDNTVFMQLGKPKAFIRRSLGTFIGGLETASAGYGVFEILAGRGGLENNVSLGTILVGGILIHEIWLASFGR